MEEQRVISKRLENILIGALVILLVLLPFAIGIGVAYYFIGGLTTVSLIALFLD